MLQIKNISKQYQTGELIQDALKNVSLNFRDNEFVSILGPSGSGKTTLLNIIGGLDRYDSGDLIINNVSTKNYKDRDWDSYRNHTIGFVFQSYNLIMHQTVLSNVELALTIGGISKKERKARALKALDEVGLKEQAHKKPNQMSGGQMQRVAIARALVNNPDILLADEPTGALDTETSKQVMELLKKVAKDRLVIMVTHNPELAEEYSTRIVKLKDGEIVDDSHPFVPVMMIEREPEHRNLGKAKMSLWTAFSLSFNNLLTKKARTILTSFAGSIGIIGIALILSLSTGFQNYIDKIQEDTLTSYPLTITSDTADVTSLLLSMVSEQGKGTGENVVVEKQYITNMFTKIGKNDLTSFKKHLEENEKDLDEMVSLIKYQYSINPMIYTQNDKEELKQLNPSTMISSMMGTGSSSASSMASLSSMSGMSSSVFNEILDNKEALDEQYDVLAGRWPEKYDEMILVLPEKNGMSDLLVYSLGLRDDKEFIDMISKLMAGEKVENKNKPLKWTYDELMGMSFKLINPTDTYKYNETYNIYESMSDNQEYMKEVYEKAVDLKIVGIVCAKDGKTVGSLPQGVVYTKELTQYIIKTASESEIVKKQLENRDVNVFTGKPFDDESDEMGIDFQDLISVDEEVLKNAFGGNVGEKEITEITEVYINEISKALTVDVSTAKKTVSENLVSFATGMMKEYVKENKNDMMGGMAPIKLSQVDGVVNAYLSKDSCQKEMVDMEKTYAVPKDVYQSMYAELLKGMLKGYISTAALDQSATDKTAVLNDEIAETLIVELLKQDAVSEAILKMASGMTEAVIKTAVLPKVGELSGKIATTIGASFNVDQEKIASAFQFNMTEEEVMRLIQTMTASSVEKNANTNLLSLGYQDIDAPTSISFYFKDFESKEKFVEFLDDYNKKAKKESEEKEIKYTDITGLLMSSVKTIVDSVTYVLIAFVSISLIVSSIMIGIITYISVLERTKEIGVLRAIGASKKNISSIFNAETFIVGLFAGMIGVGTTLALVPPINYVIHTVTGNLDINAVLPVEGAIILVVLSVILTLIGGLIPSKQAAKKDPVLALRSE